MFTVTFEITTDAAGDYTNAAAVRSVLRQVYRLYAVQWVDGDLADGVDAVLSVTDAPAGVDTTLLTLTDANNDGWYYPRVLQQDAAGANLTTHTQAIVDGTLKLAVSGGGDTKSGKCIVYLEE